MHKAVKPLFWLFVENRHEEILIYDGFYDLAGQHAG